MSEQQIHLAAAGEQHAACGAPTGDGSYVTAQPTATSCDDCFQAYLEEAERLGVRGFLGNPEGRKG